MAAFLAGTPFLIMMYITVSSIKELKYTLKIHNKGIRVTQFQLVTLIIRRYDKPGAVENVTDDSVETQLTTSQIC